MLSAHITSPQDLVTTGEAIRRGFAEQAAQKAVRAAPYVIQAETLRNQLSQIESIETLATRTDLRAPLLAAVGLSDKAQNRLTPSDLEVILQETVARISADFPETWREQLVYRYLLNRGDTLGGSMRNLTGAAAQIERLLIQRPWAEPPTTDD